MTCLILCRLSRVFKMDAHRRYMKCMRRLTNAIGTKTLLTPKFWGTLLRVPHELSILGPLGSAVSGFHLTVVKLCLNPGWELVIAWLWCCADAGILWWPWRWEREHCPWTRGYGDAQRKARCKVLGSGQSTPALWCHSFCLRQEFWNTQGRILCLRHIASQTMILWLTHASLFFTLASL